MSYVNNISDVGYNHKSVPYDVRCRDLYVDGNFIGPDLPAGPTGATGPVGPTGETGPTGPTGKASTFAGQGFSVELFGDTDYTVNPTLVPFNNVNSDRGEFNTSGWYSVDASAGLIEETGTYIVSCSINYIHNFNAGVETVRATIFRNGLAGQNLVSTTVFYAEPSNDTETVVCTNIVNLLAGDTISVYLEVPVSSNQLIGTLSRFSCQRIA